jgi:hypothetical protein
MTIHITYSVIDEARAAVRDAKARQDRKAIDAAQERLTIAECDWSFVHSGRLAGIDMGRDRVSGGMV